MADQTSKPRPDFAVIGAMRGGTTQLYELLRSVSGVCVPRMKETDFFCSKESVAKGPEWYARQFSDPNALWGDISPNYAKTDVNPDAPALLHAANPDMKLFFIARDPVERAISHYKMSHYLEENLPEPEHLLSTWSGKHILHASHYHKCLVPFWDRFGDQITILDFETLVRDPNQAVAAICETLGIEPVRVDIEAEPKNSFDELSRRPDWWNRLRQSDVGDRLRGRMPRPLLNLAKRKLALAEPKAPPPPFPQSVREKIAERLVGDARRFRAQTGLAFESWSI
ncbi:MAG: sulfotransferase [Pseudomonadota bacterium]